MLYSQPNRTSASDDLLTGFLLVFILSAFVVFFLILPGLRSDKLPTFVCVTSSLLVASALLVSLPGTSWHVGRAPISAAYKAFSRDRIQGELSVMIGLHSANVTLRAHKYYTQAGQAPQTVQALFGGPQAPKKTSQNKQLNRNHSNNPKQPSEVPRLNVDINYNERFHWIGPNQMRLEHHKALERGLPYPILTVADYLSQDEAGFSWSRQYRLAGYYTHIIMWLALCTCVLMFVLHCAAPKYGIYTMQLLGCLLLASNLTYATLVPSGEQKLVIPLEGGQSLAFHFGWNFWLVLVGGCVSLFVGTLIVIVDFLFPNFIFTTILDVHFERHRGHCPPKPRPKAQTSLPRPERPPFLEQRHLADRQRTRAQSGAQASLNSCRL